MKVKINVPINPTENPEKILSALEKFFPKITFKQTKSNISGNSDSLYSLELLQNKILQRQIKGTVKYLLLEYKTDTGTKLMLNKQSLVIGKVNFVEEEYPLGNVNIEIEEEDLEKVIDYLIGL